RETPHDARPRAAARDGDPTPRRGRLPGRGVWADRRHGGRRAQESDGAGAARESADGRGAESLSHRSRVLPPGAGAARPRRARRDRCVSFTPRPPGGALHVRPGARVAVALVRDRGSDPRERGGNEELDAVGRPRGVRRRVHNHRGAEGRMAVTVLIPTPLRPYVGGRDAVQVEAASIGELLHRLSGEHIALRKHLFADDGRLRSFVNVYVNDRDIRQLSAQETPVQSGDTVSIIPSIAGGTAVQVGAQQPVASLPKLSHEEILRYSRHLILPDVGVEGQRKLKAARVLLV